MTRHLTCILSAAALTLAACNGSDKGGDDGTDTDVDPSGNGAPPEPVVTIEPALPVTGDAITVQVADVVDPDGDAVTYNVTWKCDDATVQFKPSSPTIAGEKTVRGQTWTVTVVATDGTHAAKAVKTKVTIGNAAPVLDPLTWSPTAPLTNDTITATTKVTDPEGDKITWNWSWKVNGTEVKSGPNVRTFAGTEFDKGDTVVLDVTADDGNGAEVALTTGPIVVGNTAPTPPFVAIVPQTAADGDDLVCGVTFPGYDVDNDTLTYTYSWLQNGLAVTGATTTVSAGDTMPASRTHDGDSWVCLARSNDGTAMSAYQGWDSVTVGDAPPLLLDMALGANFTCASGSDGTPSCWGVNDVGQTEAPSADAVTDLAAGTAHACGIVTDGSIVCWGRAANSRLNAPEGVFSAIAASGAHSCALDTDGLLACWGTDLNGESTPPTDAYLAVAVGYEHGCAIGTDHAIDCWGHDVSGRITPPAGTNFSRIAAGGGHSCAIDAAGGLTCWGDDTAGQATPPAGTFTRVGAGLLHSCAIKADGALACWGDNSVGQLNAPAGDYVNLWAGESHTCAMDGAGAVVCWGDSTGGVLKLPYGEASSISAGAGYQCELDVFGLPLCWGADVSGETYPPYGHFTLLDAGYSHTCAIDENDDAYCWGDNSQGQLAIPAATKFQEIGAGLTHTCGRTLTGDILCWGSSSVLYGQQTPPTGQFIGLAVGGQHNCAWKQDGTVTCWGFNGVTGTALGGQARPPATLLHVSQVVAGSEHSCAIDADTKDMVCWGINFGGRPNGDALDRPGPFKFIAAGDGNTCGIFEDGHTECWGINTLGQNDVPQGVEFTYVTIGTSTICGLDTAGGTWCWGENARTPLH
jgi:alpha-tubulin suppressor-like RCC1 family protein